MPEHMDKTRGNNLRLRYEFDGPGVGSSSILSRPHPTETRQSAIRPAEAHQPSNQAYRCYSVIHWQRTEGGLRCSTRAGHFFARCYFVHLWEVELQIDDQQLAHRPSNTKHTNSWQTKSAHTAPRSAAMRPHVIYMREQLTWLQLRLYSSTIPNCLFGQNGTEIWSPELGRGAR
jgi:hypothetical protein